MCSGVGRAIGMMNAMSSAGGQWPPPVADDDGRGERCARGGGGMPQGVYCALLPHLSGMPKGFGRGVPMGLHQAGSRGRCHDGRAMALLGV